MNLSDYVFFGLLALGAGLTLWARLRPGDAARIERWKEATAKVWKVSAPVLDEAAKVVAALDGDRTLGGDAKTALVAAAIDKLAPGLNAETKKRLAQAAHQYVRMGESFLKS